MTASVPALEYANVTKHYGETLALEDFTLTVDPGEFIGLLGPNGAGKTTAIHLATGLAKLQEGSIRVFGHDVVAEYQAARQKIGLAPQEANFDRFFSVLDCLIYQGGYFGIPRGESEQRAHELLELFELLDKKEARPPQLSGGQKRRLLLAKAVIHDPEIVILDEPTAGLDVELRHKLWDYLHKLKDRGKTMLLTTHYIEEVEALANRVAILRRGKLVLDDSIEEVLETYGRYQCVFDVDRLPPELGRELQSEYSFLTVQNSTIHANRRQFSSEIREILDRLIKADVEIEGLRFEETELEDIFLDKVMEPS